MKIAIALATYNGARFLGEQLESLLQQTRPPDHVVISDDLSTDDTLAIVERFQRSAPYRVDVLHCQQQLGPMGNFLRAAEACDAEVIAFCDQDDIWLPSKLDMCERALQATGSLAVVHSTGHFRETAAGPTCSGHTRVPSRTLDGLKIPPHYVVRGMSLAVRKVVFGAASRLKRLWEPRFNIVAVTRPLALMDHWSHAHDMYLLTAARLLGSLTFVRPVLAHQRVHEHNYSSVGSGWRQATQVTDSWGHAGNLGYRVHSAFCESFAAMLKDDACAEVLPKARHLAARECYERWSAIWQDRAALYAGEAQFLPRITKLLELATKGAYRGSFDGGLGKRSLGKDTLAAIGFPGLVNWSDIRHR